MSLRKIGFFILSFVLVFASCTNDDVAAISSTIEIDLEEKRDADNDSIVSYLETHYYNSSAFDANNTNINNLVITEINKGDDVPAGNTLLFDNVEKESYTLGDIIYEYYILRINQGGGYKSPKFSDHVLIAYEGFSLLNDAVFDSRLNPNPSSLDLSGTINGWKLVIPSFNTSINPVNNGDGTFTYNNSGAGMMFIPSGLAYLFDVRSPLQLVPLVFKFELLDSFENDHDNDGIPSYLEDLDDDLILFGESIEEDNTDGDNLNNFVDNDDDGDGILTRDELKSNTYMVDTKNGGIEPVLDGTIEFEVSREEDADGVITIKTLKIVDSNGDNIKDYLDADIMEVNNTEDY
ncbi:hypothetical protein [uncultured Algibacter sp.]|uniref:FKBP-type peptidyl-prolyl cis-trans isomerase n=1 Tax=uncultured Algibacter sp. TaxID=298659 RepID=UPI002606E654|nr:hypothetical protein [uncultured Algibacter sp.]